MSHPAAIILGMRPRTAKPPVVWGENPPRYQDPFRHCLMCAIHDCRMVVPPQPSAYDRKWSKKTGRPPWCPECREEERAAVARDSAGEGAAAGDSVRDSVSP